MDKRDNSAKRTYLDESQRFGFMVRGKQASCKEMRCVIGKEDPRLFDNQEKRGPVCLKCAKNMISGNEVAVITEDLSNIAARVRRLEDFLKTGSAWNEHVKLWRAPE